MVDKLAESMATASEKAICNEFNIASGTGTMVGSGIEGQAKNQQRNYVSGAGHADVQLEHICLL